MRIGTGSVLMLLALSSHAGYIAVHDEPIAGTTTVWTECEQELQAVGGDFSLHAVCDGYELEPTGQAITSGVNVRVFIAGEFAAECVLGAYGRDYASVSCSLMKAGFE
jgi:hypothetical protein